MPPLFRLDSMGVLWRRDVGEGGPALHSLHFTDHNALFTFWTAQSFLYTPHLTRSLRFPLQTHHLKLTLQNGCPEWASCANRGVECGVENFECGVE